MQHTTEDDAKRGARHGTALNGHPTNNGTDAAPIYTYSTFSRLNDNSPKAARSTWPQLCELLSRRALREGKHGPLFSGASYPPDTPRGNEGVSFVSVAILDFDDGAALEEIQAGVSRLNNGDGTAAFIYSTHSHNPDDGANKYRLTIPLLEPVAASDWPRVWKRLALHFGGAPDEKAKDAARIHFLPSCPKEREAFAVAFELDGSPLDVATLPQIPPDETPPEAREMPVLAFPDARGDNYALKAFEGEIGRLCATTGNRNDALNCTARRLGQFIGAGRLDRSEVEAALLNAARVNGYIEKDGEAEARRTIKSGLGAGQLEPNRKGEPRESKKVQGATVAAPFKTKATDAATDEPREVPLPALRNERGALEYEAGQLVEILRPSWTCAALSTHAAHAARIVEHIGADLRFGENLGWLTFTGRYWKRDDRTATQTADRAKALSQIVRDEGGTLYDLAGVLAREGRGADAEALSRAAASHIKHAKQAETKTFLEGALHFAAGTKQVRVTPDAFDQRPWLLGFENGVWDGGQWREHRREDFLLHLCPVVFDAHVDRSEWERVLHCITGGDPDFARTLQDVAGYILSGASHLRFLPWLYGPKGTGKSTFAELLQTALGRMAATVDPKKLQDDAARERLGADLWNRRLAVCAEAGGQKLEAELLKTLSGSDTLTVRFLYQESFNALPRHVLLMVSNDAPRLDAYDDALKDRVVALPFVHRLDAGGPLELSGGARIEAVRKDPTSPLVRGFVAWALDGLARVHQTQSIFRAPCIEEATAKFWADTDTLTPFWETLEEAELRDGISKTDLRARYEKWCQAEGARPFNRTLWARACESRGLESFHDGTSRGWRLTQLTQLRRFPESPREAPNQSKQLSGKVPSYVSCVSNDDGREKVEL